jgi:hypothetical protein
LGSKRIDRANLAEIVAGIAVLPMVDDPSPRRAHRLRRIWVAHAMIVDTSAVIAIAWDEPERARFEDAIEADPVRLISAPGDGSNAQDLSER